MKLDFSEGFSGATVCRLTGVTYRQLDYWARTALARARQAVDCLRDGLGVDLATASLVLTSSQSVLAASNGELVDLLRGGQGVFNIVPMSSVVADIDGQLVTDGDLTDEVRSA